MSEQPKPNIAYSLQAIHQIITRGLDVSIERSRAFADAGYPDEATREGFLTYARTLASTLHGHHLTEDELAFPYFRDKLPEAPFDKLVAEHREMEEVLGEIEAAVEAVAAAPEASAPLNELNRTLKRMRELWQPHIRTEEEHLAPEDVGPMLPVEEHARLAERFGKHSEEHSGPGFLVVPFMLYNLPPGPRALMAAAMPPMVTQELVPGPWKEKWAPMKPFLLD